ncbi:hypothetical protein [Gryllotalpicola protaetiae]|uniref:Uncharacterized protein n=1 Tax=Gryllotalpicola protaetiae TaxID=2419771 RepID=A0A387BYM3_9MICO|nr:hypothetical protein [Gryllotalpicola protaetiae]AYG03441.1 hypothetical protein D7I44_07750 [Gryllotalpicola protaetiae]
MRRDDGNLIPMGVIVLFLITLVAFGTLSWLGIQVKESGYANVRMREASAINELAQSVVETANVSGISAARATPATTYTPEAERVRLNGVTVGADGSLEITITASDLRGLPLAELNETKTVSAPLANVGSFLGMDADSNAQFAAAGSGVPAIAIWQLTGKEN